MEKKKGFLLIEFIVSFGILSFAILLFAQFFLLVVGCYQEAQERLYAVQMAQNCVEQAWKGDKPSVHKEDKINIQIKHWPILAGVPPDLPHGNVHLVYQAFQVSRANRVIFTLPGYLYEASSS